MRASKAEQEARLATTIPPDSYARVTQGMRDRAAWWAAEVERLEGELLDLLSGSGGGDDDEDASQAGAVLARSKKGQ